MTSSPLRSGASQGEELDYYKRQYEQLETDLADFQASSKELEEQLERDIDAAEKNERKLKEQVEKLGFEVDEWKGKHRQAKTEANNAQNTLQKEITSIREQNRALQLRLRDIEVANDDYERQARNTTTSLEDLDSKLNVSIERGVLLEEEVKNGDSEREALRIENQRLRDELGDLKVESEITLEKLRLSGKTIETLRGRKPGNLAVQSLRATSPGSEVSGVTPSSPTIFTPPARSDASEVPTPPSPPLSDEATKTTLPDKRRSIIPDTAATPRPAVYGTRGTVRHSRGPSLASRADNNSSAMRPPVSRPMAVASPTTTAARLPRSESLHQMKSLRLRMQKIEERVQSARSKLPAPRDITPKASPLNGQIPSSITVRRASKRESTAMKAESTIDDAEEHSHSHIKRLSYGISRPASRASTAHERTPSRYERPPSAAGRPASRLSVAGGFRPSSRASGRDGDSSRPQSSLSGAYSASSGTYRTHRPSASVSELRRRAAESEESVQTPRFGLSRRTTLTSGSDENTQTPRHSISRRTTLTAGSEDNVQTPRHSISRRTTQTAGSEDNAQTPRHSISRRTTLDKGSLLQPNGLSRRPNLALSSKELARRTSVPAVHGGAMRPPVSTTGRGRNVVDDANEEDDTVDLGETY